MYPYMSHTTNLIKTCTFILQSLTKPPADYPDKKGLPHVQVALRMLSRNLVVQAGDVIPYIMCKVKPKSSPFIEPHDSYMRTYQSMECTARFCVFIGIAAAYYVSFQVCALLTNMFALHVRNMRLLKQSWLY